jgi:hypothetical protein
LCILIAALAKSINGPKTELDNNPLEMSYNIVGLSGAGGLYSILPPTGRMQMECKNCGKIIDARSELKFCTGCGTVIGEEKSAPKNNTRESAGERHPVITERAVELDTRTRFFYSTWLAGFFVLYTVFQISIASVFLSILAAILFGALLAILGVIAVSRMNHDLKHAFNETFWFVPAGGPGRRFVESLASTLPLMAKLPQDNPKQTEK